MVAGFPRPIYLVVCNINGSIGDVHELISHEFTPGVNPETTFDPELTPILPAIWYGLHLPSTRFDAFDLPLIGIREALREKRRHLIFTVPAYVLEHPFMLAALIHQEEPTLILSDDDSFEAATVAS